jgi:hypothetical protein
MDIQWFNIVSGKGKVLMFVGMCADQCQRRTFEVYQISKYVVSKLL